jgi:hypothetical protein
MLSDLIFTLASSTNTSRSQDASVANNSNSANNSTPISEIVRVAEAAIAAQRAAEAAAAVAAATATTSKPATPAPTSASLSSQTTPPSTNGPNSASSSQASLSNNPYAITTQYLKSPTGSPMSPLSMNPYAVLYGPSAPMTPGTPTYPPFPYYYMGGPMPGPNGMYPPGPFPPPGPSGSQGPSQSPPNQPQNQQKGPNGQTPDGRPVKPKRLKAHTVTSKSYSIPMVPRDKTGRPMLPLNVGIMTVISLGNVCMREHFHTERYIFPVGYEVTRSDSFFLLRYYTESHCPSFVFIQAIFINARPDTRGCVPLHYSRRW